MLKEQAVQPFSKLVTVVAESEARRENAKLAVQKTEHVDFAYLLKLAKDFEIVLVSQVQAELERDPSSVYTPLDPEIKAEVGAQCCRLFYLVRFAKT